MSVRMALAELAGGACGGAIIGGGAVHVAQRPRGSVKRSIVKRAPVRVTQVRRRPVRRIVTATRATCPPAAARRPLFPRRP